MWGISCLAENHLASQEEIRSMEYASKEQTSDATAKMLLLLIYNRKHFQTRQDSEIHKPFKHSIC